MNRRALLKAAGGVVAGTAVSGCSAGGPYAEPEHVEEVGTGVDAHGNHVHGWVDLKYSGPHDNPYADVGIRFVDDDGEETVALSEWWDAGDDFHDDVWRFEIELAHQDRAWYATDVEWRIA